MSPITKTSRRQAPAAAQEASATQEFYGATRGRKGKQGDKGDKGDRGPVGLQGERGPVGLQGERGPVGLQGERGLAGGQDVLKWIVALFLLTQLEVLALYLWWLYHPYIIVVVP